MSCVVGDENQQTVFVLLNKYGDVVDHLSLHFIKSKVDPRDTIANTDVKKDPAQLMADQETFRRRKEDLARFSRWVKLHVPAILFIDASERCKEFKKILTDHALFSGTFAWADPRLGTTHTIVPTSYYLATYLYYH